jgi:hypothetical protein
MIHCKSLAIKELCQELTKVMDTVIKTVNYIKAQPVKGTLFVEFGEEMWAQYQSSLFYPNYRWLSKENVVACLQLARRSSTEHFVSKFAYLGDIF